MRNLSLLTSILLIASAVSAQPIPRDTAIHFGKLPNGFTYYIRHNAEPKNQVVLYLVNKAGSILEDTDQLGLAHFMEHMNFNGTKHYPKNELVNYLQKSGVRFGADLNAFTSFDETVYQLPIPSQDSSIVRNGLQIMRDWAHEATLDSVEINKERGVVLEEERLGKGAGERFQRKYLPVVLNQSRYSQRLPIGKENILKTFPPGTIKRFLKDWYRPNLQALVVVGDVDVARMEKQVRALFADLKNPVQPKTRTAHKIALNGKNNFLVLTDPEMPVTQIEVLIKHRSDSLLTQRDYVQSMKKQLFNSILGERLADLGKKSDPPFVDASGGIEGFLGGLNIFYAAVVPKAGLFKEAFKQVWTEVERAKRFGFTASEIDRAKANYLSGMEGAYNERQKTNSTSLANEYQRLFLNKEASPGIGWEYDFVKKHLNDVTLASLKDLASNYIKDIDRDILILAPDKEKGKLPDSIQVAQWIDEVNKSSIAQPKDEEIGQSLLNSMPAAGKIVSRTEQQVIGVTTLTLSNGVRVILKPTTFKDDEIRFSAFSKGGTSLYSDSSYDNAANAASIIADCGLGKFSNIQLERFLTGKRLSVEPSITERFQGIRGTSSQKDLTTAFQLMYLQMTQPRKDPVVFQNALQNTKEILENRSADPGTVFSDTIAAVMGGYSYRRLPPSLEKLRKWNLDTMFNIYKERFSDATDLTLVVVGSFKVDSILPLLETYIASLPASDQPKKFNNLPIDAPSGQLVKKVYKGSEDKATVNVLYNGEHSFVQEENLKLTALKEILQVMVIEKLREDESKVYAPSVQLSLAKFPRGKYSFRFSFGCAPANVEGLVASVKEQVTLLRDKGPSELNVEKFKKEYLRQNELGLATNGFWTSYLQTQLMNEDDELAVLNTPKIVNALSIGDLTAAAKKYLGGDNIIQFILLPVNK